MAETKTEAPVESALDMVKEGLRETLGLTQAEVDELAVDALLGDLIDMDELDKIEFQMWIEERTKYTFEISDEEAGKLKTVGDWAKIIEARRR